MSHTSTHVIFSNDDLAVLECRLGTHHPICERLRCALSDLAEPTIYRAAAFRQMRCGELEIDDSAVVSKGDDPGAYVMAWLWVSDEDAGIDEKGDVR